MENPYLAEQNDTDPRALVLFDERAQFHEERLDIRPTYRTTRRSSEQKVKRALVSPFHSGSIP